MVQLKLFVLELLQLLHVELLQLQHEHRLRGLTTPPSRSGTADYRKGGDMLAETLRGELHQLESETFEIEDVADANMDEMAWTSSSCSCSSCCSCSTSSCSSCSTSCSSCG